MKGPIPSSPASPPKAPALEQNNSVPGNGVGSGRPKVLFIVSEDRFFWSHRLPVARAALRSGFEVTVATRVQTYGQQIQDEGFRLIPLKLARDTNSPLDELSAIRELRQIYKSESPDFVHRFALKPVLYGSIAALGCTKAPGINALTGLGYLIASSSWKARVVRFWLWKTFSFLLNRPQQRVVVENDEDRNVLIRKVGVPPDNVAIVRGSGVDVEIFQPSPEPVGVPVIVLASRMLWIKGIREFAEAARLLRSQGVTARFVLAGDTDHCNPSSVPREQILEWQNSGTIEWWGHQENMPEVFKQANIVCLPSHGGEGIPQVLLEAAASGRALVSTDTPGCHDIVRNGVNGIVVKPRDVEGLARALADLAGDARRRNEMARQSREIAIQEFSQEAVLRQIMEIYSDLCGRPMLNSFPIPASQ